MSRIRLEAGCEPFPGLKLVQLRGRGGFAEVWEAINPKKERIAVKFMASRNSGSSSTETRIIQAIQKLDHPNLLQINQVWSIPDYIVVAMELADGSLLDLLDIYQAEFRHALTAELVLNYLAQAAKALDYLNARKHTYEGRKVGFLHRDVKPSNFLVVGEKVKLADFGLCVPMGGFQTHCDRCGTLDFAAPEVHRGAMAETSDQYSLAVTYYHLRTGEFPFPTPPASFRRDYSYQRPAPELGGVSHAERLVLERALHLEPNTRWPSCTAMVEALSYALAHPDLVAPGAGSRFTTASTVSNSRAPAHAGK